MNAMDILQSIFRWIHVVAGILWIGMLYFFNWVNGPFAATLDAETKKKVVPQLAPRALFWFRWGAMVTFLVGWLLIYWKFFVASGAGMSGEGGLMTSTYGQWIMLGGTLGSIMWFNVWFIIWPSQKKIISWIKAAQTPPEMAGIAGKAALASKINVYLSLPMLFCMGAASHLPMFNLPLVIGAVAVGFAIAWHLFKVAPNVGKMNW